MFSASTWETNFASPARCSYFIHDTQEDRRLADSESGLRGQQAIRNEMNVPPWLTFFQTTNGIKLAVVAPANPLGPYGPIARFALCVMITIKPISPGLLRVVREPKLLRNLKETCAGAR